MYLALGKDSKQRAKYYRAGFKEVLDEQLINEIRASVQTGTPLGNDRFKTEIEQLLGVKVGQSRRGRPKMKESVLTSFIPSALLTILAN